MKANTLIFVKPFDNQKPEAHIQVAFAPIIGKEYEYDMTQARFYAITPFSAEAAKDKYGIPYSDWQAGACSDSEKFPCCE